MHETLHSICHLPQYAYLPMRSTRDALMIVAEHCAATRRILMGQARSIHVPSRAQPKPDCCGGIQIFLDLHRAFDQLPRQLIADALQSVDLSSSILPLMLHWHQHTHCHINVNNTSRQIEVKRGVRQGCCAAPYIWACVIACVLERVSSKIPVWWLQQCLTIFAG